MTLASIRAKLQADGLYHAAEPILDRPTVIGYDKQFRWAWMATQLNTFVVATDFGAEPVTVALLKRHGSEAFRYAQRNYTGWPRGLQSGLGVVQIALSREIDPLAAQYCRRLAAEKSSAGFTVPVAADPATGEVHAFDKAPMWGRIYFPYFRELIAGLAAAPVPAATPPPLPR